MMRCRFAPFYLFLAWTTLVKSFVSVPKVPILKIMKSLMFSGIVEEMGTVNEVKADNDIKLWDGSTSEGLVFKIRANSTLQDAYIGCSISLNGVCLTVIDIDSAQSTVSDCFRY